MVAEGLSAAKLQETGVLLLFNSTQMPPPPGGRPRSTSILIVCIISHHGVLRVAPEHPQGSLGLQG